MTANKDGRDPREYWQGWYLEDMATSDLGGRIYYVTDDPSHLGWRIGIEIDFEGRTVGYGVSAPIRRVLWGALPAPRHIPGNGPTATLMREIRWFEAERAARHFAEWNAREELRDSLRTYRIVDDDGNTILEERVQPESNPTARFESLKRIREHQHEQRAGRPRKLESEVDRARAARRYAELVREGGSPIKALAEELGYSTEEAKNLVYALRFVDGFLTKRPAGHRGGRAYGELTEEAKAVLARAGSVE